MLRVLAALAVVGLGAGGLGLAGYARQRAFARRALADLHAHARPTQPAVTHARLAELPPVVGRWLRRAVPEGAPVPRVVSVEQHGLFRMKPGEAGADMRAHQEYTLSSPGFVWDARIRVAGIPFYGLDSLIGDRGVFSGRVAGLVQVLGGSDDAIVRSSMLRYLGELPLLPQMPAMSDAIRWEAVDDRRARAWLTVGEHTVTGLFEFDHEGRPIRFSAERDRDVDGRSVPTPWLGEYEGYARVDGVEVPSRARVSWILPEGPYTYWEADLEGVRFLR